MELISRLRDRCFCAYCKADRKVYNHKHVSTTNVVASSLFAMAITYSQWGTPDPRGIVIFFVFIGIAEIFVYSRWRASLVCKLCGFDPIVYKRNPEEAARGVRKFFEEQKQDPRFHLSRSPLLELQKQITERERKANQYRELEKIVKARNPSLLPPTKSP